MTNRREKHDPNSQEYTNALFEDIDSKFQTVLEVTAPIPKMQEDISDVKEQLSQMQPVLDAVFEEVGTRG